MTRLGTNNVILRVDAKTEKIVDILTGKSKKVSFCLVYNFFKVTRD